MGVGICLTAFSTTCWLVSGAISKPRLLPPSPAACALSRVEDAASNARAVIETARNGLLRVDVLCSIASTVIGNVLRFSMVISGSVVEVSTPHVGSGKKGDSIRITIDLGTWRSQR